VAISDRYTGVYPRSSPGGRHLLGRTRVSVRDVARQPPALFTPGMRVRLAALGVGRAGAVDRESLRLANRLVGNAESAADLELVPGGLRARCAAAVTVTLAGGPRARSPWDDAPSAWTGRCTFAVVRN
jgi:hypothetical protein